MPFEKVLDLKLSHYIKTINTFPMGKGIEFDHLLSDISNYVYDAYEYILDLEEDMNTLKPIEQKRLRLSLQSLLSEITPLLDLLCNLDHNSKYMDRAQYFLGTMEKEIEELLKNYHERTNH